MSPPRQVLAGTTCLVTRRCAYREFLLRPSRELNGLFLYLLAVAARRHDIRIHAFCVMSNHFHLLLTDPGARVPAFMQYLNSLVARALNVALGRSESLWSSSKTYSRVTPVEPKDAMKEAAYVLANPVAAGLVARGREWPGLWSAPEQIGVPIVLTRPDRFFRANGPMPETCELELTPPPFASAEEYREQVSKALADREREIAAAMKAEGREFMGAKRVLAQKPTTRPATRATIGGLNPTIAAGDKAKRLEALAGVKRFREAYRAAWKEFKKGVRDVVFPHGTYWLRVAHGVRCEAPA